VHTGVIVAIGAGAFVLLAIVIAIVVLVTRSVASTAQVVTELVERLEAAEQSQQQLREHLAGLGRELEDLPDRMPAPSPPPSTARK
jgi:predicted PurR-regulated permease PerM